MRQVRVLLTGLLAVLTAGFAIHSRAEFPDRPVRVLVGAAAGGPTDIVARLISDSLSKGLGRPVMIDNRAGAGGNIATQAVATAPPDGYTLLMGSFANAVNPAMMSVPYDTRRDLIPISQITRVPLVVIAHKGATYASIGELVAEARRRPGTINIASGGIGTSSHLAAEMFKRIAGVDMLVVHYKGGAPALQDVLSERVQIMFDNPQTSMQHIKSGSVKLLAVTTAARLSYLPTTPAVAETPGFANFEVVSWHGLFGRAGTPPETIARLSREITAVMANKEIRDRFSQLQIEPVGSQPPEFNQFFSREMDVWGRVVREANIKAD